jgi:hypothetical protein
MLRTLTHNDKIQNSQEAKMILCLGVNSHNNFNAPLFWTAPCCKDAGMNIRRNKDAFLPSAVVTLVVLLCSEADATTEDGRSSTWCVSGLFDDILMR